MSCKGRASWRVTKHCALTRWRFKDRFSDDLWKIAYKWKQERRISSVTLIVLKQYFDLARYWWGATNADHVRNQPKLRIPKDRRQVDDTFQMVAVVTTEQIAPVAMATYWKSRRFTDAPQTLPILQHWEAEIRHALPRVCYGLYIAALWNVVCVRHIVTGHVCCDALNMFGVLWKIPGMGWVGAHWKHCMLRCPPAMLWEKPTKLSRLGSNCNRIQQPEQAPPYGVTWRSLAGVLYQRTANLETL